ALLHFEHYLQDQLLKDADCMSMRHSIELRVPYLSHRLVAFVASLPAAIKLDSHRPKPLLLDAVPELPEVVWRRPKMGFTLPMQRWLQQDADAMREESMAADILDPREVGTVWEGFLRGRVHWSRPWALLVLARFLQQGAARA
ncbi:MAG: asparagine synthase-related protein, partial [Candidatus Xenobia bacterium]